MKFSGKTCIVFGGAGAIGQACTEALLEKGANVVVADIKDAEGATTAEALQIKYPDSKVVFIKCDVSKEDNVQAVFDFCLSTLACAPDIVTNCAGVVSEGQHWRRTIDINIIGTIHVCQNALEAMSKENGGKGGIVTVVASIMGLKPFPIAPVYTLSKHSNIGYIRALGDESNFMVTGVRFNALCPTFVDTPFLPKTVTDLANIGIVQDPGIIAAINDQDLLTVTDVSAGLIELIENDDVNGQAMRVSIAHGRDFVVFPDVPVQ